MLRTVHKGSIASEFTDPYLELVFLLNQAAGLEHSLMAAYLSAAFSIKDRYARVRGDITNDSYLQHSTGGPGGLSVLAHDASLLEVCIEEMQHLGTVNRFLGALGGSPTFVPQEYPLAADIYPFPIVPMPLDRYVAATFLWMEAASCALSLEPACEGQHEPAPFIAELLEELTVGAMTHHHINVSRESVSHVGTLYAKILEVTR
ncbi:MAG TPA: ferritin-like domain-containing protein, partial [Haliangium sp.]|nr:ferritin-like domain-containing protein [Haliangium sp.]